MSGETILRHGKLAVLEMLAKHIHDRDFINNALDDLMVRYNVQCQLSQSCS